MIELTQVKSTDKLGQLQGILNNAFSEIQTDQPFIGYVMNPSISIYKGGSLVAGVTASRLTDQRLFALCFPESNGVFVAKVFGRLSFTPDSDYDFTQILVDIPGIKLPTRDAVIGTFVAPNHLGITPPAVNTMTIGNAFYNDTRLIAAIEQHDTTGELKLTVPTGSVREEAAGEVYIIL